MKNQQIAIIGAGNLGKALINGLLENQLVSPDQLYATRRTASSLKSFEELGVHVSDNNREVAQKANLLILAVKPYNIQDRKSVV